MKNLLFCFLVPLTLLWGSVGATNGIIETGPDGVNIIGTSQVCKGEQTTYSINSPNPGYTYGWTMMGGGGTIISTTATTATVLWHTLPSGTLIATAYDGPTSKGSGSRLVNINEKPDPFITSSISVGCASQIVDDEVPDPQDDSRCFVVCQGSQVIFTANGNPGSTFAWSTTGGSILSTTATTATVQFNTVGFGQITVTETTSTGCKETEIRCVEVIEKPNAEFQIIPASVMESHVACVNSILNFIDLSSAGAGSPIISWQWDFGDNSVSNDPNPSHTYTTPGNYTIVLTVENECHCKSTYAFEIEIIESEPVQIECPAVVCENSEVFYTATDPNGCENFQWDIIGGTATTGDPNNDPQIGITWDDVDDKGFGYISVTPLCGEGCPTSLKIPVIKSVGVIDGPDQLCEGKEYLYRLPRWPATKFEWSLTGNAQKFKTDQPNEIVVVPGVGATSVTLRCTYQNDLVSCGGKASIELNVVPPATFSGPEEACIGVASTYTLSGSFYGSWKLRNQAGTVVQTGSGHAFSPTFAASGTHMLSVTGGFCTPDPLEIEVMPLPPAVNQITGPDEVCAGIPYSFYTGNSIPGTTLNWSVVGGSFPGSATNVSGEKATITFAGAGPYQVKVWRQYQSNLGCQSATLVKTVTKKQINLNIDGEQNVCANTYQNYEATYLTGDLYEWSIIPETMGSVTGGDGSRQVTILWNDLATAATAQLQVKMRVCNTDFIETINVNVSPSASIALNGPASICRGHSATFTVPTSLTSYGTVEWDFGDGTTTTTSGVGALSVNHTYQALSSSNLSFTVSVKVNDANGCNKPALAQHVISVKPSPVGFISPAGRRVQCAGTTFNETITASVPSGGATFQWYKDGVLISGATSASYTVVAAGDYYCKLTSAGNSCTSNTNTISFSYTSCSGGGGCTVTNAPDITLTPTVTGCGEITVGLSNPNGGTNPRWDPSPASSSGSNYVFNYPTSGNYFVTFTVDRPDGMGGTCEHSKTIQVTVPYIADLKYTVECGFTPGKYRVTLLDNSNYYPGHAITNYSFTINGATHSGSSPSYQEDLVPGTYPVQLVINDGTALPNCTINDVIELPAMPVANFTFDPDATCKGFPIQFVNTSTPASGLEYAWDFGDGAIVRVKDPSRVFDAPNIYEVELTVTNELGCSSTFKTDVEVVPNNLNGDVLPSSSTVCSGGLTLTYNPSTGNPDTYYWQPDSFAIVTTGPTQQVHESGSYFVTVTDANKCVKSTGNVSVEFVPTPQAAITGPTDVCVGEDIKLYGDAGAGNYTYQWKRDGVVISTNANIVETGLAPGPYVYELTVSISTPIACSKSATHTVVVRPQPPQPDFTITKTACTPAYKLQLSVVSPEPTGTYTWSDGQSGSTVYVNKGGEYTLTYTSPYGCSSSFTQRADKSPWEYIWIYPLGCYELCPAELPGAPAEAFDIPDPIIDFDDWEVLKDGMFHVGSVAPPEVPDARWEGLPDISGAYSYSLTLNGCTATSQYTDLTIKEDCCELEVDAQPMEYIDEDEMCRNVIDIFFGNPSGQPITISLSSTLGTFVPNTVTVPPGGGSFTFEFYPFSGITSSSVGTFRAVSSFYLDPERKERCTFEDALPLPSPLCDANNWKRAVAGSPEETEQPDLFQLAPNPANTEVSIIYELPQWTASSTGSLEIHDLRGARIAEFNLTNGKGTHVLNTTAYKPSVYLIILRVDGQVMDYRRLVIQR